MLSRYWSLPQHPPTASAVASVPDDVAEGTAVSFQIILSILDNTVVDSISAHIPFNSNNLIIRDFGDDPNVCDIIIAQKIKGVSNNEKTKKYKKILHCIVGAMCASVNDYCDIG